MATDQGSGGNPYDDHDWAVMQRINDFIAQANQQYPKETVALKLNAAWAANVEARRQGDSTDTVGRDADYYFAARHVIAADKSQLLKYLHAGVGEAAWTVYAIAKLGAEAAGHPEWTRTDPDKPNAPVGGFVWMNRGAADGFEDRGDEVADVIPHQP